MTIKITNGEKKLIQKWIFQSLLFIVTYIPIFFFTANDWYWNWGWLYMIMLVLFMAAHPLLLIPINPKLLAERARGSQTEGTKHWDRIFTIFAGGLFPFASQLLSALDHRYAWSLIPEGIKIFGSVFTIIGYAIFIWAMVSNAFFTEGVRIQAERGHSVCDTGPYRFVRHPGYVGSISSLIGTPMMLDSIWGLIPAVLGGVMFVLRTVLEDRTLKLELDGYAEYANRVKCKLIPGLF